MPSEVDRHEVMRLVKEGAQLVDVLPEPEYTEQHLPGATNLPLKSLNRQTVERLDRSRPVIVYCHDSA